jgi:hypothetical protein
MTYVADSVSVNDAAVSGDITDAGINIGSLAVDQEVIIKFYGLISTSYSFPGGSSTVYNSAFANADNTSQVQSVLSILITAAGGRKMLWLLLLTISLVILVIICAYLLYTRILKKS